MHIFAKQARNSWVMLPRDVVYIAICCTKEVIIANGTLNCIVYLCSLGYIFRQFAHLTGPLDDKKIVWIVLCVYITMIN